MTPISAYSADTLVQQTTAEYLEQELGWQSAYAYNNEDFGPDSLLGRESDREVVLTRTLRAKIEELNSGLPATAYEDAVRQIVTVSASQTMAAANREKLANGVDAKLGSLTSRFEHFHEWKRLAENQPGVVAMETLLKGVCAKVNFLDLVENFIVFDDSAGESQKVLARNHQYLGVNRAVEAVRDRKLGNGKLGVFWHTQGSGESYSMMLFTRKVHRKLGGNFTFLILTDRDDLDTQIYKTFAGTGDDGRGGDGGETEPAKPDEELRADLREAIAFVRSFLAERSASLDGIIGQTGFARNAAILAAKEAANENDETRKRFEVMCRAVFSKFKDCITMYNREKDRVTIEKTFEALLQIMDEMDDEESRAVREGLDEESLAVFDLLRKPDLTSGDIKRIKAVAIDLLETLKTEKLRINHWRDKESTRDAVRLTIQDYLWSKQTGLPETYSEEDVWDKTEAVFVHAFRAYPTVPSPYYASMAS